MFVISETLDDALREVYKAILETGQKVTASRGDTIEIIGVLIQIDLPRSRLSRSEMRGRPYSALGELLWYLAHNDNLDFIAPYVPRYKCESEDGLTVHGAYGPRLFAMNGHDQIANVIRTLKDKKSSRRAVIQIFDANDLSHNFKEIPCTTTMQFLIRDGRLSMITNMRSNDAYMGLPHDVFCFTMIQEIIARAVGVDIGPYRHFAGSLHLYEHDRGDAQQFLSEGFQSRIMMPPMPLGDPWVSISKVLDAEYKIRNRQEFEIEEYDLDNYWKDIIRMLLIFDATGNAERITEIQSQMSNQDYGLYIRRRMNMKPLSPYQPIQLKLSV